MKRFILLLILVVGSALSTDAQVYRGRDMLSMSLSIGANPTIGETFYDYSSYDYGLDGGPDVYTNNSPYRFQDVLSPAISFACSYRTNKWFAWEMNLSYANLKSKYLDRYTDTHAYNINRHSFSIVPVAKFLWLNRSYISLYSSVGIGARYSYRNRAESQNTQYNKAEVKTVGHFVPIGMSFGKRLYGFTELGPNTTGAIRFGLGYVIEDY